MGRVAGPASPLAVLVTVTILWFAGSSSPPAPATAAAPAPSAGSVQAVSIDPADYLAEVPDASVLARRLASQLAANGVDAIYVNAYNVEYGAYYRTSYPLNQESDYGRQDLLGKLVAAAHAKGIRVFAAFYDHQHRGAWEAHPGWRAKTESGGDYNPPVTDIQYYLSTGHPEVLRWWQGFLQDLLRRYPNLDGVELREPIVTWWGTTADHNPAVTAAFRRAHPGTAVGGEAWRRFRQDTLTRFLHREIALIHAAGRIAHVTTVADVDGTGTVLSVAAQAHETGFDLDGVLTGPDRPDAVKVELIWQQWARLYGRIAFTPEWTGAALRAFARQVRGRAELVAHVELTDFGRSRQSVEEFLRTLRAVQIPVAAGIDFYSAALADRKHAWPAVRAVYASQDATAHPAGVPRDRRVLVLGDAAGDDRAGRIAALERTELLNLVAHAGLVWEARDVDGYRRGELEGFDAVIYLGSDYGNAPTPFLTDASVFDGTVVWIGQNLFELAATGTALPFRQSSQRPVTGTGTVRYHGSTVPARGELIPTRAGTGASVVATQSGPWGTLPYLLRAGRFWYVAGSPFSYVEQDGMLNGRYLVFADALHDMLGVAHPGRVPAAFVRIEDVNPLTDPTYLDALVAVLRPRGVPFLISVTPFYVDPATHTSVALSERPALVQALRAAVAQGGAIVLHGETHQYRGRTGIDAEFWDLVNHGGVVEDSEDYVRPRLETALTELWRSDLHPLAWETPHYLATPFDYALFSDDFSTFVERRAYGVIDGAAYQQPLPYIVESDVYGGRIVPENLGFVERGSKDIEPLLRNASALRVVRDATAGGYVHVTTPPALVARLVDGLEALGYRMLDLYAVPNEITASGRAERTGTGSISLPVPTGWTLEQTVLARDASVLRSSRVTYSSYARPTVTLPRGAALLGVEVLSAEALARRESAGTSWWERASLEHLLLVSLATGACAGLVLLLGATADVHRRGRRLARR